MVNPSPRPQCPHDRQIGRCAECQDVEQMKYAKLGWLDKLKHDNRGMSGENVVKAVEMIGDLTSMLKTTLESHRFACEQAYAFADKLNKARLLDDSFVTRWRHALRDAEQAIEELESL